MRTNLKPRLLFAALLSALVIADCAACPVGEAQTPPQREMPLPAIPPTLTRPHERAAYLLRHFWDALDFTDTATSRDRGFMEQNFANFVSVFPHADTSAVAAAVEILLRRAEADKPASILLAETAEKYLWEYDSPLRDDGYCILFMEEVLRSQALNRYEKIRPAHLLAEVLKNRAGRQAADFGYTDRHGNRSTLHGTECGLLMIVFYDPECAHCLEIMKSLSDDGAIHSAVESGRMTILAVFADGEAAAWQKRVVPEEWCDVMDTTGVQEHDIYSFRQLPAIYLLDSDKTVLVKEADATAAAQLVARYCGSPADGDGR